MHSLGKDLVILWLSILAASVLAGVISGVLSSISHREKVTFEREYFDSANELFFSSTYQKIQDYDFDVVTLISKAHFQRSHVCSVSVTDTTGFRVFSQVDSNCFEEAGNLLNTFHRTSEVINGQIEIEVNYYYPLELNFYSEIITRFTLVFSFVLISSGGIFIFYFSTFVRKPLKDLQKAMIETLARRKYVQASGTENTEVGRLTAVFNEMQLILSTSQTEIERGKRMRAIGTMTSGVAHEMNNVLAVIRSNIDLLKVKNRSEEIKSYVNQIDEATDIGASVASKLLLRAKEDYNEPKAKEQINIGEFMTSIQEISAPFVNSNIDLKIINLANVDVQIDISDFRAAAINLIKNSAEAMSQDGSIVIKSEIPNSEEIRSLFGQSAANYVKLSFSDNGPGIPAHIKDKLFEPFATDKKNGTGLGLWSVYWTVQKANGLVKVEDLEKDGTHISIYLPCVESSKQIKKTANSTISQFKGLTVCLVEDHQSVARGISALLTAKGLTCRHIDNYSEALSVLKNQKFDLVICDQNLPDGDGWQLCSVARGIPDTIVVLYSGNPSVDSKQSKAVHAVLTKPVGLKDITELLEHHFEKSREVA